MKLLSCKLLKAGSSQTSSVLKEIANFQAWNKFQTKIPQDLMLFNSIYSVK